MQKKINNNYKLENMDFTAQETITYENQNGNQAPIEYCEVVAFGLRSENEPPQDWDLLESTFISPNNNGQYSFLVSGGYPWYRLGILLNAKLIYSWWVPPDNWDGISSVQVTPRVAHQGHLLHPPPLFGTRI